MIGSDMEATTMRNRSWAAWLSIGVALPLVVFLLLPAAVQAAEE